VLERDHDLQCQYLRAAPSLNTVLRGGENAPQRIPAADRGGAVGDGGEV